MATMLRGNALVTGAGSGIGQAVALSYAQAGCDGVVLADINATGISDTAKIIGEKHPSVKTLQIVVDVSDKASVQEMMATTVKTFGELHYGKLQPAPQILQCELIELTATNCAGITCTKRENTCDYDLEEYDKINSINARGLLLCLQEEIKVMKTQKTQVSDGSIDPLRGQRGSVVNIASVTGIGSLQNLMPYVTSKHAVLGITKSAAIDHARHDIRINAVCPGFVQTQMMVQRMQQLGHNTQSSLIAQEGIPMGRMAFVEEVADVCVFLSSSRSSYMNGSSIVMDGGKLASFQYSEQIGA